MVGALLHLDPDALGAWGVARHGASLEQAVVGDWVGGDALCQHLTKGALWGDEGGDKRKCGVWRVTYLRGRLW
eukprot:scaffold6185_cov132-Isochrysis_galbana.AAC.1